MSCGNRIYKGADVVLSFPFNEDEYTDLSLRIYTDGEYSIERVESGMTIADGNITVAIEDYELGLLKDGIIYYTINYTQDGLQLSETTNTPYVLKEGRGYSAQTPSDIYQRGFDDGLDACEHPEAHLQSGVTLYMDGDSQSIITVLPESGYVGMTDVTVNAGDYGEAAYHRGIDYQKSLLSSYETNYNGTFTNPDGWSSVTVDVHPRLQDVEVGIDAGFYEGAREAYISAGTRYQGLGVVHIYDDGAWSYIHGEGEAAGKEIIKNAAINKSITANGVYTVDETVSIPEYYKQVNVNVEVRVMGKLSGTLTLSAPFQFGSGQSTDVYGQLLGGTEAMTYASIDGTPQIDLIDAGSTLPAGTYTFEIPFDVRSGQALQVYDYIQSNICTIDNLILQIPSSH